MGRGMFLRVGLLLVVGAGLLVGLAVFLSGGWLTPGRVYETYFRESVQGLSIGSSVKYRGVSLGDVTSIGLTGAVYGGGMATDPTDPQFQQVLVRFRVDTSKLGRIPDVAEAVAAGLRTRLASQGLTGLAYIELDFVPNAAPPQTLPWQPAYEFIPSVPSTFSQVQDAAQRLAARLEGLDIEGLVNNINGLAQDLRQKVAAADIDGALAAAKTLITELQTSLKQSDLPGVTADLRQTSQATREFLRGPQLQSVLANTANATAQLAAAAAKLGPLLAQVQGTVQRADGATADLSAELAGLLRNAAIAVANLRDTTETLRRDPGQVLFGAPPPPPGASR